MFSRVPTELEMRLVPRTAAAPPDTAAAVPLPMAPTAVAPATAPAALRMSLRLRIPINSPSLDMS